MADTFELGRKGVISLQNQPHIHSPISLNFSNFPLFSEAHSIHFLGWTNFLYFYIQRHVSFMFPTSLAKVFHIFDFHYFCNFYLQSNSKNVIHFINSSRLWSVLRPDYHLMIVVLIPLSDTDLHTRPAIIIIIMLVYI